MNLALIGCGLAGKKRALALGPHRLVWAVDKDKKRAEVLAKGKEAKTGVDWRAAAADASVAAAIIATPHDDLAKIGRGFIEAGKPVLIEKPGALNTAELKGLADAARAAGLAVRVGFNHRFHPALMKAHELADAGEIGEILFIRAVYGHGGRRGYETEWRAKRAQSGGGQLIDQGAHLIDLARWFLGDCDAVAGYTPTYFWNMEVEDNAFIFLRSPSGRAAWLHAGWTEWKNRFHFEVFGKTGKLEVTGLGGTYGTERLVFYKMKPEMGPPVEQVFEYPEADPSWGLELETFVKEAGSGSGGNIEDALAVLEIVEKTYKG